MCARDQKDFYLKQTYNQFRDLHIKRSANERQKTRNMKRETKWFSTPAVYRLRHSETKKKHCFAKRCFGNQTVFDSRNMFSSEHVRIEEYMCLHYTFISFIMGSKINAHKPRGLLK